MVGGGGEGERVAPELPAPPLRRPPCLLLLASPELLRFSPEILHLLSPAALRPLGSMKLLRHAKWVGISVQIYIVENFTQSDTGGLIN